MEARLLRGNKDYYCRLGKQDGDDFLHRFAREFCIEGFAYRAGDAVNFAIGQGDTIVTPAPARPRLRRAVQRRHALWARVGKAIVDPEGNVVRTIAPRKQRHGEGLGEDPEVHRHRPARHHPHRHLVVAVHPDFPLDEVKIRSKTGSAEVYGKQGTSWLASCDGQYVVIAMVSQGGTGSGTSGPAVRKIWETLYGVRGSGSSRTRPPCPARSRR